MRSRVLALLLILLISPLPAVAQSVILSQYTPESSRLPVALAAGDLDLGNVDLEIAGTAIAVNAGAASAQTLRVILASDDPAVTSLAILDDWDESDRAKVNLIVGQAGIAAGAGAVGATVPRVTLASDDPAVVALQILDNLVLAEDGVHSSGESGVLLLGVRNDAGTALAADGDRIPLSIDSSGAIRVTGGGGGTQYTEGDTDATITGSALLWEGASNTLTTVASGTPLPVTCATCSGSGVQHIDDAAFTPATDDIVPIGGVFDDTTPDSVNEGDGGAVRMSGNRNLYVTLRDAAGNERGLNIDASGQLAITVASIPSHAVTNAGTFAVQADTELATAAAAADNFANPTAGGVLAFNMVWDGSTWDRAASSLLTESAHDAALTPGSVTSLTTAFIAKDFDGAALPNAAGAENDQVLGAATLSGVQLMMLVSEDGSLQYGTSTTPLVVGDGTGALNVICDSGCSGGTAYTVNAVAPADPVGTAFVMERDDALSALSEVEGDWTNPRSNANGALWVSVDGSVTVTDGAGALNVIVDSGTIAATQSGTWNITNISGTVSLPTGASTLAEQQTQTTALQLIDNIIRAEDVASAGGHEGAVVMAVRQDTPTTDTGADGDYTFFKSDSVGRLHVTVGNTSLSVTNGGTFVVQENGAALTALQLIDNVVLTEDLASAGGESGVQLLAVRDATPGNTSGAEGDFEPLQVNAGRLWVDASGVTLTVGSHAVTNAGTFVVQIDGAALTALQKIDNLAHSGSDVALVEHVPMSAQFDDTSTTTVTENQIAPLRLSSARALHVNVAQVGGVTPAAAVCDDPSKVTSVAVNATASGNTELVALTADDIVYICGYNFMSSGAADVRLVYGTGTACATGETGITGLYPLIAQTGIAVPNGGAVQAKGAVSNAVCIESSATVNVRGLLSYVKE